MKNGQTREIAAETTRDNEELQEGQFFCGRAPQLVAFFLLSLLRRTTSGVAPFKRRS